MVTELSSDLLNQARMIGGHHSFDYMDSIDSREILGQLDGDQRRVLGLLEALDYDCFDHFGKDPNGIDCITLGTNTIDDVKQYLVEHKKVVRSLPMKPFVLGLLAGTFDFLQEGDK